MCRLLAARDSRRFAIHDHLGPFSEIARDSREFQGHGWGCSYIDDAGDWRHYHSIRPIWEDDIRRFPSTCHLLAHARSAFRDENIAVENNMPFHDGRRVFIFNGELHGVRIKETGRIGAEKIFNYIRRLEKGDMESALARGVEIIRKRSRRVRAMNIVISDGSRFFVGSHFDELPEYFTMHVQVTGSRVVVCSDPFDDGTAWRPIPNGSVQVI